MVAVMSKNKAQVVGVLGRTGTGKSLTVKRQIKAVRGLMMCWDFKREYDKEGFTCTDRLDELVSLIEAGKKKVAFWPSMETKLKERQFDFFCRLALELKKVVILVEELKFVTKPSWAPEAWSLATLTGRHDGLKIIATSQRPASIDKDFFGSCTTLRTFALPYPDDAVVVAKALGVPVNDVLGLEVNDAFSEYIEKVDGQVKRGRVRF